MVALHCRLPTQTTPMTVAANTKSRGSCRQKDENKLLNETPEVMSGQAYPVLRRQFLPQQGAGLASGVGRLF